MSEKIEADNEKSRRVIISEKTLDKTEMLKAMSDLERKPFQGVTEEMVNNSNEVEGNTFSLMLPQKHMVDLSDQKMGSPEMSVLTASTQDKRFNLTKASMGDSAIENSDASKNVAKCSIILEMNEDGNYQIVVQNLGTPQK